MFRTFITAPVSISVRINEQSTEIERKSRGVRKTTQKSVFLLQTVYAVSNRDPFPLARFGCRRLKNHSAALAQACNGVIRWGLCAALVRLMLGSAPSSERRKASLNPELAKEREGMNLGW